ncbi:MAG: sugar phosphate isomerase/epimerase family protein [Planctomycetota bacterium]
MFNISRLLIFLALAPVMSGIYLINTNTQSKPARDDSAAEKLGWRLGMQCWTLRDRTCFEAIETSARLGIKYTELFPGQILSKDHPNVKVGELSEEQQKLLIDKLKSHSVKAVSYGVVNPANNEKETRKIFEFAKALGLENISCEPAEDALGLVEKLCAEYSIKAAIHNHPKPSHYWNPDTVLRNIKDRNKWIGACADTGHWSRSGLVPVECLKKLEGRIVELHFKDIENNEDRPWGTGKGDARTMLTELKRQGFRGLINIEYETGSGKELEANVTKCIEFFDRIAGELSGK